MMAISCSVCSIPDWRAAQGPLAQRVEANALGLPRALFLVNLTGGVVSAGSGIRVPLTPDLLLGAQTILATSQVQGQRVVLLVAEGPLLVEQDAPTLLEFRACGLPVLLHTLQRLLAEPDLFRDSREDYELDISRSCTNSGRLVQFSFASVCAAWARRSTRCARSSVKCCRSLQRFAASAVSAWRSLRSSARSRN